MTSEKSEEVADNWLRKYGDPVDCPAVVRIACIAAVESERSRLAALRLLKGYVDLSRRHRKEKSEFLRRRVPGESVKLSTHLERVSQALEPEEAWPGR